MKQKTAMMELVEVLEDFVKELDKRYDGDPWVKRGVLISINEAKQLLEKEKEQILDTYWGGLNGSINDYSESKIVHNEIVGIKYANGAENYYNQTYLEESK